MTKAPENKSGKQVLHIHEDPMYIVVQLKPKKENPSPYGHHRKGITGPQVAHIQDRLIGLGYKIDSQGSFGPQTERALRDFQRKQGLPPTGVADARTLEELEHPGAAHKNVMETIAKLRVRPEVVMQALAARNTASSRPAAHLSTSDGERRELFEIEGGALAIAQRPYWPGGASGVTIGAGYDMKSHTKKGVHDDLVNAGVADGLAWRLAEGAGLSAHPRSGDGMTADRWRRENADLQLTSLQSQALFRHSLVKYEGYVRRAVSIHLLPNEFDALVSFTYNAGPDVLKTVALKLNHGDVLGGLDLMQRYLRKGNDPKDDRLRQALAQRRRTEVEKYLYGH